MAGRRERVFERVAGGFEISDSLTRYLVKAESMKAGSFFGRRRQPLDTELRLSKKQSRTADLEWSDILGNG